MRSPMSPGRRDELRACEPLEPRLALATATFTDVDGDVVTVTTSKGTNDALAAVLTLQQLSIGSQLRKIDLAGAEFAGTDLRVTARRVGANGDGFVNVGEIFAAGRDLGKVSVKGDLGRIVAGDAVETTAGLKSLTVGSIGRLGETTGAPSLATRITGAIGTITVNGDIVGAIVTAGHTAPVPQFAPVGVRLTAFTVKGSIVDADVKLLMNKVDSIHVGGSIRAGAVLGGSLIVQGPVTKVKVGGGVWGGEALGGFLHLIGGAKSVTIGGSLVGGFDFDSGSVIGGRIETLVIGGDMVGGIGERSGHLRLNDGFGSIAIGGDVVGGLGEKSGFIEAGTNAGKITIGGSLFGGVGGGSGAVIIAGNVGSVAVSGDVVGGSGATSGSIASSAAMNALRIGGSLRGGAGLRSGRIGVGGSLKSTTVTGAIHGGGGSESGAINAGGMTTVGVGGSVVGGAGTGSGRIDSGGLTGLGVLTIGGSLVGGLGASSGVVQGILGATRSVRVKGALVGGPGADSGMISIGNIGSAQLPSIEIGRDIESGPGANASGQIAVARLRQLVVRGGIRGTPTRPVVISATGTVGATPAIGSIVVNGSMERCLVTTGKEGIASNARIGSVKVDGDMIASSIVSAVTNQFGVFGNEDDEPLGGTTSEIGSVTVKGRIGGSPALETFGIVARSIGAVKLDGTVLPTPAAGVLLRIGSSNAFVHRLA